MPQNLPKPPELPEPPKIVQVLVEDVPDQMMDDIDEGVDKLLGLPFKIDEDVATLVVMASKQPEKVAETLYELPGTAPENVDNLVDTLKEGFEYKGGSEETRGERMRRVTDVIDLFTPT